MLCNILLTIYWNILLLKLFAENQIWSKILSCDANCILHWALLLTVISSCTEQLDTIAYWCILLLIVTYCFKMLCMVGHGWLRFCTAAGGCICANIHILLQIDANRLQYGRISLYMCWITYGCIYILKWMHDVNLILV